MSDPEDTRTDGDSGEGRSGEAPVLAIGIYIGALLTLYGLVLIFYGWLGSPDNSRSLGHPFDIWWGAVMIVVGVITGGFALVGKRASERAAGGGDEARAA